MSHKKLPSRKAMLEVIESKPDWALIGELTKHQARCVHDYISQLTIAQLIPFHPDTTVGLHKIMSKLETHHRID